MFFVAFDLAATHFSPLAQVAARIHIQFTIS